MIGDFQRKHPFRLNLMTARTMTLEEANTIAQRRIEELEAENKALREAAQAVVTIWLDGGSVHVSVRQLAALLEE